MSVLCVTCNKSCDPVDIASYVGVNGICKTCLAEAKRKIKAWQAEREFGPLLTKKRVW